MKLLSALVLAAAFALGLAAQPAAAQGAAKAAGPVLTMETTKGAITIKLRPDLAPRHVERILQLVKDKFYDGVPFHRVIAGFMAQTGDPTGTGTGGSKYPDLRAEFSKESFRRGSLGMARSSSPDSANSQFFICFAAAPWLDGQYTIIGDVTAGMDVVDKLNKGDGSGGMVPSPDKVTSIRLAGGAG